MRIFCDAYCPWTVLCVYTQHLSARSSGLTLLCGSHDWGKEGVSGSKMERVVTLANSPLGLRRRLVDEEFDVEANGFGRQLRGLLTYLDAIRGCSDQLLP